MRFKDLTGKRFGQFVVVKRVPNNKHGDVMWLCRCDCGNEKIIIGGNLTKTKNPVRFCRIPGFHGKLEEGEAAFNQFLNATRHNASKRGYEFSLTKEQARKICSQNCFYCGEKPSQIVKGKAHRYFGDFVYNGIDRMDNSKGYTIENSVACCGNCNRIKSDMTIDEFKRKIFSIYTNWASM